MQIQSRDGSSHSHESNKHLAIGHASLCNCWHGQARRQPNEQIRPAINTRRSSKRVVQIAARNHNEKELPCATCEHRLENQGKYEQSDANKA